MSCDEIRDLLVLYVYGELTFDQEETVDAHLAACVVCRRQRTSLATLHNTADDAAIERPSTSSPPAARISVSK